MDRAKATFFNAKHQIAGALAKPTDAEKAVTELMKSLGIDTEEPSSSSTNDATALKALSLLWGNTVEHEDREISRKIDGYRKHYVAAKGGNSDERAVATRSFDKHVKQSLLYSLGPRNHSIVTRALCQQDMRFANGNVTEPELHAKMAGIAKQIASDVEHGLPLVSTEKSREFFNNEVKGALGFVNNSHDLMHALNYVWGALPGRGYEERFNQFEKVMDDVVAMAVQSEENNRGRSSSSSSSSAPDLGKDHAFKLKKREFIAESRKYLGSLLPDSGKVKAYEEQEASARITYMQGDRPDNTRYKAVMLKHLASMQTEVLKSNEVSETARLDHAVKEAVNGLLADEKPPRAGSKTLSVTAALKATYQNMVNDDSKTLWKSFKRSRKNYVDVAAQEKPNERDSSRTFMRATQKVLIERLPAPLGNNFKELLVELDSLSERGFIADAVYNACAIDLLKKVNGEVRVVKDAGSSDFLQVRAKIKTSKLVGYPRESGTLQEEVTNALGSVLAPGSDHAAVLDCLGYFWGDAKDRFDLQRYDEFNIRRNKYAQAHGGEAYTNIPTDCAFVAETRRILVGQLPAAFQEKYKAQQDALEQYGMSPTETATSTRHFLLPFSLTSLQ